jgi:hypothetical protein
MNRKPIYVHDLIQGSGPGELARIIHGGGKHTHIVCGFLGSDQRRNPLFATLPTLLTVDMTLAGAADWIEPSLRFAISGLREGRIATSPVMRKLSN